MAMESGVLDDHVATATGPAGAGPMRWAPVLGVAALVVVATAAVFAIRLHSVIAYGDLYAMTGGEGPVIYSIWKAQNGYPVYEPIGPNNPSGSFYNGLFYYGYAYVLKALSLTGSRLVLGSRLLTLALGGLGAVASWLLMRRLAGGIRGPAEATFLGIMTFLLWFGTGTTSWFIIGARSDVPALALAVLGLWLYTESHTRRSVGLALAASLAFAMAWGCKQSVIGLMGGCCLHSLVFGRDARRAVALIAPCALLEPALVVLGGEDYRYNILKLTSSLPLRPALGVRFVGVTVAATLVFWVVLAYALIRVIRRGRGAVFAVGTSEIGPVALATLTATAWGWFTSGRLGSNRNHLFEMAAGAVILASVLIVREMRRPVVLSRPGRFAAFGFLIAALAALPTAQLVAWNRIGRVSLATPAEYESKKALAAEVAALPKPLFAHDEMLALPWYSSGGRYPAIVLDLCVYDMPVLTRLIEEHHFRALVIPEADVFYTPAIQAGYVPGPVRPEAALQPERVLLSEGAQNGVRASAGIEPHGGGDQGL